MRVFDVAVRFMNPFRGTRVKPKVRPRRPLAVPSEEEVRLMLKRLPPKQAAMVALMSGLGLRCGALGTLAISGGRFSCVSKGKEHEGEVPGELLSFLRRRVRLGKPFAGMSVAAVKKSVEYHLDKLFRNGEIRARYSCHDFRHYFAVVEYGKDRDIWRVSRLLGHSSLASTEKYLRGLGGLRQGS